MYYIEILFCFLFLFDVCMDDINLCAQGKSLIGQYEPLAQDSFGVTSLLNRYFLQRTTNIFWS